MKKQKFDFRQRSQTSKFLARKAWQMLFNVYRDRNGDLTNLDNLQ